MSVAEANLTDRITYDDLYRRWEQNNWQATAIDFSQDRKGWEARKYFCSSFGAASM